MDSSDALVEVVAQAIDFDTMNTAEEVARAVIDAIHADGWRLASVEGRYLYPIQKTETDN